MSNPQCNLSNLPTELVVLIYGHLTPPAQLFLSLTCQRLYYIFTDPPHWKDFNGIQRYEYLLALERDGIQGQADQACCSACEWYHEHAYFLPAQLSIPQHARLCCKTTGQLWVTPSMQFSYSDLEYLRNLERTVELGGLRFRKQRATFGGDVLMYAHHDVLTLPKDKTASMKSIGKMLAGFDLPICPHTRLSDSVVIDSYKPSTTVIDMNLTPTTPLLFDLFDRRSKCSFPFCHTSFFWSAHASPESPDWKTVYVHIERNLGDFLDPRYSKWRAQLIEKSTSRLEAFWNDCMQWKKEMMAIEKRRYELEALEAPLQRAEEAKLRQLEHRANYLHHPHRSKRGRFLMGYRIPFTHHLSPPSAALPQESAQPETDASNPYEPLVIPAYRLPRHVIEAERRLQKRSQKPKFLGLI
ncbi:hypothetical protein AJ80_02369 [Polytolypa hystricis UAMH7299]|uniref:F-box domain-containing protein n=1 Tax=Polytolypa hystricis (strain UAMH7299) TaxID=1447883 RepID=A0A2B7YRC0_POLH7|nr:hypothetical protein AJ80_02369 [Polytolypa hystricis UAMH7299]